MYNLIALALLLAGAAGATVMAWRSDGFYQDDDITHFLFAEDAWTSTDTMLHWWGRPGYTIPTMFAAHFFGVLGCRIFSIVQTAAVAWLAYRIARRLLGPSPAAAVVPALVWLQPLVAALSFTTLTETPAALYLTLGVWLYLRGNRVWGCAATSLLFVTRYETLALMPILAAAVLLDAYRAAGGKIGAALRARWVWACAAALLWAPVVYCVAAAVAQVPRGSSPLYMFWREYSPVYGRGAVYHFLVGWPGASGVGVLALAAGGALLVGRRYWLPAALAGGLVVLHSLIFSLGAFASGGYPRFLVPAGGLVAVLAGGGLRALWQGKDANAITAVLCVAAVGVMLRSWDLRLMPWKMAAPLALAAVAANIVASTRARAVIGRVAAAAVLILAGLQAYEKAGPLTLDADRHWRVIGTSIRKVQKGIHAGRPALTGHVLAVFLRPNTRLTENVGDALQRWQQAPPGTLFFWENKYNCTARQQELSNLLYRQLWQLGRPICQCIEDGARAEVFLRMPPVATSRAE